MSAPVTDSLDEFLLEFSRYSDTFLARRSVLHSSLFPEKPQQMYFGYRAVGCLLEGLLPWMQERVSGEEFGASLRTLGAPVLPVGVAGATWGYLFYLLGDTLEGREWDPVRARAVLRYWHAAFAAYMVNAGPRDGWMPADGFSLRLLDSPEAAALEARLDPAAAAAAQPFVASATNYSWLTEAESRQGVGAHGLYALDGGRLLVREFLNLAADRYPWVDPGGIPRGRISVLLRLDGADADFDCFGVVRVSPETYAERVTGAAVRTEDGFVDDPAAWLVDTRRRVMRAHRTTFATVAGWSSRERFIAAARSYCVMWEPTVRTLNGTDADVERLIYAHLERVVEESLDEHLTRSGPPPIWASVNRTDLGTIFGPVLERL